MLVELNKHYKTNDGRPVMLHDITNDSTFPVKGSIFKKNKGRHMHPEYMSWKLSGQCLAVGVSCYDLVEVSTVQINDLLEKKPLGA